MRYTIHIGFLMASTTRTKTQEVFSVAKTDFSVISMLAEKKIRVEYHSKRLVFSFRIRKAHAISSDVAKLRALTEVY